MSIITNTLPGSSLRDMMARLVVVLVSCMFVWTVAINQAEATTRFNPGTSSIMQMKVPVGQSETVKSGADISNLVVGDPDIADASPLGTRSFYILGRKTGRTNLSLYDADDKLLGVISVEVTFDTKGLKDALRTVLPR
ncbi:MAG: pilus assembly protein N-terminal domain-containing protein, partial [Pseudomonadota bacterium]